MFSLLNLSFGGVIASGPNNALAVALELSNPLLPEERNPRVHKARMPIHQHQVHSALTGALPTASQT